MPSHREEKILPYTPEQIYSIVRDVASYHEFLPWCQSCKILSDDGTAMEAEMTVGVSSFQESYTSDITCQPHSRIDVNVREGLFKKLINEWAFEPAENSHCRVTFFIDFEFKNMFYQMAMSAVFSEATKKMMSAFEKRAAELYP